MHPLKFDELIKFHNYQPQRDAILSSSACTRAKNIFGDAMFQIDVMAMVPGYAFMNGETWGLAVTQAMRELGVDSPYADGVDNRASQIWDDNDLKGFGPDTLFRFNEASVSVERMVSQPGRELSWGAMKALLNGIIIQSWSAYETLAGHIIKFCKEDHPKLFNAAIISKKHPVKSEKTIVESYQAVFGGDQEVCDSVWNSQIKAAALVRHLLVHSRGIVDESHKKQRALPPIVTDWDAFAEGDEIPIDGALTRDLFTRILVGGFQLSETVSKWVERKMP